MRKPGIIYYFYLLIASVSYANDSSVRDVSVEVPKSEIQLESTSRVDPRKILFNLSVTYWNPQEIQFASRPSVTASEFDSASIPKFSGEVEFAGNWLRPYFGAQFFTTTRRGAIQSGPTLITGDQRVFLGSLTAGAKVLPGPIQMPFLFPYFGVAVHPSALFVNSTILSDDAMILGAYYEISAGFSAPIRWLPKDTELSLGIDYTFGKIRESKLNGLGIEAGLKFSI